MARRIVHQLVDDIDGQVLESGDGETVAFSFAGASYEIDLSQRNAEEFRAALEPWIAAARRVSSTSNRGRGRSRSTADAPKHDLAAIRAWAGENGHQVSDRGRVPATVLQAYDEAH